MDYDTWKTGYYEQPCESLCRNCEMNEQKLDDASEFLEEIVKQLYNTEELDSSILEHCLDELCYLLRVPMNKSNLNVVRPSVAKNKRMPIMQSSVKFLQLFSR